MLPQLLHALVRSSSHFCKVAWQWLHPFHLQSFKFSLGKSTSNASKASLTKSKQTPICLLLSNCKTNTVVHLYLHNKPNSKTSQGESLSRLFVWVRSPYFLQDIDKYSLFVYNVTNLINKVMQMGNNNSFMYQSGDKKTRNNLKMFPIGMVFAAFFSFYCL